MTVRRTLRITPVLPPGASVTANLGDGPPQVNYGSGGWAVVNRPKRVAATDWQGLVPNEMAIPLVFDGFLRSRSVEKDISALTLMMRTPTKQTKRPPVVRLTGPVPHTNVRWVINGIEWGPEERRSSDGHRIRAFFTLQLLQYIPAEVLVEAKKSPAKEAQERNPAPASNKVYTVKKGDTLSGIAGWHLGDRNRWPEIAKLNNLRDPNRIQVGQQLRIP